MDTNGEFHIEASHHDGSAYLDVRLISGVSYDAKGFKLGGEYYAPGKMDLVDFYILLDNLYDSPDVGPCSLPRFSERTGDPDGLRAYCDPIGVGWNYGPIYYFPHESVEQIVGQLCEDGDDFPILFDGENVIEAFDGSPVHMSVPVEVDGERVWTCGYDFCWGETVAPDFSRARGHFPDATVAAWAAARSVNESDGNLGIKERM